MGAPGKTVAPDKAIAVADIVLLEDFHGVKIARLHDAADKQGEAAVQFLSAVAAYDAGRLFVGDHDVGVQIPIEAFSHDDLHFAQADAHLPLGRIAKGAGVDSPISLNSADNPRLYPYRSWREPGCRGGFVVDHLFHFSFKKFDRFVAGHRQQCSGNHFQGQGLFVAVAASHVKVRAFTLLPKMTDSLTSFKMKSFGRCPRR